MTHDEFSSVFQTYFEPIYRYVYFRVGHKQEAEDLVSTIFEKVVAKQHTYSPQKNASLKSWIFSIAHNTVVDYYRTKKQVESIDETDIAAEQSIEKDLNTSLDSDRVRALIKNLPDRKREILLLRYDSQLSHEEIGQLLSIEPTSASSLLAKALRQVRDEYNAQIAHL